MVVVAEEDRVNQGLDRPVIIVVAAHRTRRKSTGDNCSGGEVFAVVPPTTLGRHG